MVETAVERIDETSVKLTVTVEPERVTAAIDEAARSVAATVKVPGFRPGRVPRKVLETRLGKAALLQEAAREAFPKLYAEALRQADVSVVGPPEFELDQFEEGKEGRFFATVDVRPDFDVPDYEGLQVPHPEWEVTDDEVTAHLDQLRERYAQLETVERAAKPGDYVVLTITAKKDGEVVPEASGEDLLYEIPKEETDSQLDAVLPSSKAGAILEYTDVLGADFPDGLAGQEVSFTVIVKEVKHKDLPALDDDFALTASEFDTIDELRDSLAEQLGREKLSDAHAHLRGAVVAAVAELVDIPLPGAMVAEEQRFRMERLAQQAESYDLSVPDFLAALDATFEQVQQRFEAEARETVKAQLVVDAIGRAADIQVAREDLTFEVARQAQRLGRDPVELAQVMLQPDHIGALYADAFRRKTIDHLLDAVDVLAAPPAEALERLHGSGADPADTDTTVESGGESEGAATAVQAEDESGDTDTATVESGDTDTSTVESEDESGDAATATVETGEAEADDEDPAGG